MKTNGTKRIAVLALMVATGVAHGGIVAQYDFNQNLNNSAGAGYALSNVGGTGSYIQDSVMGQIKYVYSLNAGVGLSANTLGWSGSSNSYSIIMDVNLTEVSSYQKLLSFDGAAADTGFYAAGSDFIYYNGDINRTLIT